MLRQASAASDVPPRRKDDLGSADDTVQPSQPQSPPPEVDEDVTLGEAVRGLTRHTDMFSRLRESITGTDVL